ncbi:hypothetical protein D9613_004712 [Agrocybe pediades]|uniref:Fungal-type protein kinase domain-containing protein n=1 Tax=Agrocybe pediades TaxID=84607 RepID=A0A8H4R0P8_9AGAR|nr:hypothetical protein D9613_004712 [Agrocybe pediades]
MSVPSTSHESEGNAASAVPERTQKEERDAYEGRLHGARLGSSERGGGGHFTSTTQAQARVSASTSRHQTEFHCEMKTRCNDPGVPFLEDDIVKGTPSSTRVRTSTPSLRPSQSDARLRGNDTSRNVDRDAARQPHPNAELRVKRVRVVVGAGAGAGELGAGEPLVVPLSSNRRLQVRSSHHLVRVLYDVFKGTILVARDSASGLLVDWDLAESGDDEVRDDAGNNDAGGLSPARSANIRSGPRTTRTWQFMSTPLLSNPYKPHRYQDDLESLFWVLQYVSMLFLRNSIPRLDLSAEMSMIFDNVNYMSKSVVGRKREVKISGICGGLYTPPVHRLQQRAIDSPDSILP